MSTREQKLTAIRAAYAEWKPKGDFQDEYLASTEDEDAFVALVARKDVSLNYMPVDKNKPQ